MSGVHRFKWGYRSLQQLENTTDAVRRQPDSTSGGYFAFGKRYILLPWILTALSSALAIALWMSRDGGSFETGRTSELRAARNSIEIVTIPFTGGIEFTKSGPVLGFETNGAPRYVGTPDDSVDAAWNFLTYHRYFRLTDNEAIEAWGPGYEVFWSEDGGGYLAGLDVIHALHCLNYLRQTYYPDRYPRKSPAGHIHRDHCIEYIRQSLMCHSDLTPVPTRYRESLGRNYMDANRPHTCRNFWAIRDWVTQRNNGSLVVPPMSRGFSEQPSGQHVNT